MECRKGTKIRWFASDTLMNTKKMASLLRVSTLVAACAVHVFAQIGAEKLVELDKVDVQGSRLPSQSIIRLSGLKLHDKINDPIVNEACRKITATGLVKSVEYAYDMYPDRPGVSLTLKVVDEAPLLPAKIKPEADDVALWPALQKLDPMFTKQLPRTEKALSFYSQNLERCLQSIGRPNEYAAPKINGSNENPSDILFEIRQYKKNPQTK